MHQGVATKAVPVTRNSLPFCQSMTQGTSLEKKKFCPEGTELFLHVFACYYLDGQREDNTGLKKTCQKRPKVLRNGPADPKGYPKLVAKKTLGRFSVGPQTCGKSDWQTFGGWDREGKSGGTQQKRNRSATELPQNRTAKAV